MKRFHFPSIQFSTLVSFLLLVGAAGIRTNTEYLRTSCSATSYPRLCYTSLSVYAGKIKTNPRTLALAALHVNLAAARSSAASMRRLARTRGLRRRDALAIGDCVEEVGDSVFELQRSIEELGRSRERDFGALISDIETWVSSALTDEETCMEGFGGGRAINGSRYNVKAKVRRHIVKVAHFTSNSLALINAYASSSAPEFALP
ncbi:pectinesterase inhibitor 10-like [Momordica charantia]|uniref:pectinesterase n=1 Tax=Momordica charantia TaxID=3673 RepID=A0A6J1DS46_MOMCH|nr:pectinesterase inhibitor 10-like [Momordica charantia]